MTILPRHNHNVVHEYSAPGESGTMTIEGDEIPVEFHVDMQHVKHANDMKPESLVTGHITKIDGEIPTKRGFFVEHARYSSLGLKLGASYSLHPKYAGSTLFSIVGGGTTCNNCYFIDADVEQHGAHSQCFGVFIGDIVFGITNPDTDWYIEWES